ncbi:MAG: gluconate 2-dehydrogenase subunit 3 family protein [Variovorax sp.]|nr:gluconate 2-dehydrogenase subunit 3 family protein [Variovorax sp.]
MPNPEDIAPRRRFFRQAITIVPAAALAASVGKTLAQADDAAAGAVAGKAYEPAFFSKAEWAFIHAAVNHLIPEDPYGPGAIAAGVPEFIDRQMQLPYGQGKLWYMQGPFRPDAMPEMGYQLSMAPRDLYRVGIKACDQWCAKTHGKVFAELDKALQEQILKDLQAGRIALDDVPARTFFDTLLTNAKEGFLCDPIHGGNKRMVGWKLIGFPGARGDFADWVGQHNTKYPYGPVSISGERG